MVYEDEVMCSFYLTDGHCCEKAAVILLAKDMEPMTACQMCADRVMSKVKNLRVVSVEAVRQ